MSIRAPGIGAAGARRGCPPRSGVDRLHPARRPDHGHAGLPLTRRGARGGGCGCAPVGVRAGGRRRGRPSRRSAASSRAVSPTSAGRPRTRRAQLDQAQVAHRAVRVGAQPLGGDHAGRPRPEPRLGAQPRRRPPGRARRAGARDRASATPARAPPPAAARAPPARRPAALRRATSERLRRQAQVADRSADPRQQPPLDLHRLARGDELTADRPHQGVGDAAEARRPQARRPPHRRGQQRVARRRAQEGRVVDIGREHEPQARRAPPPSRGRGHGPPDRRRAAARPASGPAPGRSAAPGRGRRRGSGG